MIKRLKNQKGFGFVEVIIALGLLGIVGISFLGALATASVAILSADNQSTAESLARSEMEYVKSQDYSGAPWSYQLPAGTTESELPGWWTGPSRPYYSLHDYEGYICTVAAIQLNPHDYGTGSDVGIQEIIISIVHSGEEDAEPTILHGYMTEQ